MIGLAGANANNVEVYSQKRGWVPLKSLPDKPHSPRKLPAKAVHRVATQGVVHCALNRHL